MNRPEYRERWKMRPPVEGSDRYGEVAGCYPSTDTGALDTFHGTVLRVSFAPVLGYVAGVNIEEPKIGDRFEPAKATPKRSPERKALNRY